MFGSSLKGQTKRNVLQHAVTVVHVPVFVVISVTHNALP